MMYAYSLIPRFLLHFSSGINQQDSSCVENDNTQPQIKEFMKNDDTTNVGENLSVRNPYSEAWDQYVYSYNAL